MHDGYEWLYVLSGRLRLMLGSAGPGTAEILAIFSKQGKRIHLRGRSSRD